MPDSETSSVPAPSLAGVGGTDTDIPKLITTMTDKLDAAVRETQFEVDDLSEKLEQATWRLGYLKQAESQFRVAKHEKPGINASSFPSAATESTQGSCVGSATADTKGSAPSDPNTHGPKSAQSESSQMLMSLRETNRCLRVAVEEELRGSRAMKRLGYVDDYLQLAQKFSEQSVEFDGSHLSTAGTANSRDPLEER